jgi:iron complex transport system substrate-binding protein
MRIVSLAPSNTEILFELGAVDKVVGTTALCDIPEEAVEKPSLGGWTNPRVDRLEELEPDLVIASDDLQDNAVERVRKAGYEVLQVKPHSLEEVFGSIKEIGEKIGHQDEAEELVQRMKSELEEIELENSPRIYCEEWMNPPMISGNWIPELFERIGGNYFIEEGRSRKFDLEELKDFDPEYIFLNVCGAGQNLSPEEITKRSEWQELTAVENGNVYVVDDALLNRPGPRLVEGAKRIAEIIED